MTFSIDQRSIAFKIGVLQGYKNPCVIEGNIVPISFLDNSTRQEIPLTIPACNEKYVEKKS